MYSQTFYVMDKYTDDILFMAKVKESLVKSYETHVKGQNLKLCPAPSFEFNEPNIYSKFTIEAKKDF